MKIERTRNTARNMTFGMMEKLFSLLFSFVSRTVLIYYLGIDFVGLNSLFGSVLSVLSLAELGIGSALVYFMYQSIANDNTQEINALLKIYKKCYFFIGLGVLVVGVIILPIIPHLIREATIPKGINIFVIYFVNLLSSVFSYWFYAYKNSLISAFQRNDIVSKINTILNFLQSILQIIVLLFFRNYYFFCIIPMAICVARNISIHFITKREFPQYYPCGDLSNEIKTEIKTKVFALFVNKFGNVVANSVDSLVISAFLGLTILGIYNNYYYILSSLGMILVLYYSSMSAGVGNSIATESVEKNYSDFQRLFFAQSWIIGWSSICLLCLYQPFIELWVGKQNQFDFGVVVAFVLYYYFWRIQDIVYVYKEAAGLWEKDKYCSIVGPVFNLILNIILVKKIGIYGIIISTLLMNLIIMIPWRTWNLFSSYFKKGLKKFYAQLIGYTIVNMIIALFTYYICDKISLNGLSALLLKAAVCVIVPNLLLGGIYCKQDIFKDTYAFMKSKLIVLVKK